MIIANPIYDVVFKRLMENERVAKFFISTLIDKEVLSVQLRPREFTYDDKVVGIALFRLDFVAIIKTENGETKKVLIEIQKAKRDIDLMRFRNYLGEQYKKEDTVDGEKTPLPITTIYILGFKLKNIETACIKVERQYHDLINGGILEKRNDFVEKLSHDSYIVQVLRITGKYQSRLDKLLSIFEQANFINDTQTIKEYRYDTDEQDLEIITQILHHAGVDPAARQEIENEREAWRTINAMFKSTEKELRKKIEKAVEELDQKTEQLDQTTEQLDQTTEQLDQTTEQLDQTTEQLDQTKRVL
ncbi:MAG: hypothetical protein AAGJ82_10295, partial [Bacteroidota bacterium]